MRYAELTARRLLESVERLARFPESGRVVPELGEPTVREIPHGSYRRVWPAAVAFLVLPGTVAFLVPWLLRPDPPALRTAGLPMLALGTLLLLWCVRDFYVAGRGTLAPWAPPERLVIVGLYRVSRNPMYLAVLIVLCGWAVAFASRGLWIYTLAVAIAFHLRVALGEEPWLARAHAAEWRRYRARVPRWLGLASLHPDRTDPEAAG